MVVVSAFQGGIPCEEDSDEQEHQRHADRTQDDDQGVGLPFHRGEVQPSQSRASFTRGIITPAGYTAADSLLQNQNRIGIHAPVAVDGG